MNRTDDQDSIYLSAFRADSRDRSNAKRHAALSPWLLLFPFPAFTRV